MTGPEHYLEAENLLNAFDSPPPAVVAIAQVHATLALAAATAEASVHSGHVPPPTVEAWQKVIA